MMGVLKENLDKFPDAPQILDFERERVEKYILFTTKEDTQ